MHVAEKFLQPAANRIVTPIKDWQKSCREYSKREDKISTVENGTLKFEKCTCAADAEKAKEQELKDQLSIF